MKRLMIPVVFAELIMGCILLAQYQYVDNRIAVVVIDYAKDMVGERLVYYVKEGIRESNTFRLAVSDEPKISILINTMDKDEEEPNLLNQACTYSVIWLVTPSIFQTPFYLGNTLGYCGSNVTKSAADKILVYTNELVGDFLRILEEQ